jgi:preprotein translocase subunit SecF
MTATTAPVDPTTGKRRRHTFSDLYHERTHFEFIDRSWRWGILSGVLILISVVAFAINGLNLGIDFEGGTQWQFTVADKGVSASAGDVRNVLEPLGLGDAKVLIVGDNSVRVQSKDLGRAEQAKVTAALAKYGGVEDAQVSVSNVGPTWGDKVSSKALSALVVFFLVIAVYLTFRFEWRMALAAIVAVLHDIIVTIGVYAVTGFEVTPATVVAFLTILGFSLYDTVVVFDKVKDNTARLGTIRGDTYSTMVNRSLNQVLMRSINTSIVALLPVASLLFVGTYAFGGLALRDFALALFVGLLTGCYSSIFVATPILAWLKERQPKYRALRERAAADLAKERRTAAVAPARATAATGGAATSSSTASSTAVLTDDGDALVSDDAPAHAPAAETTRPSTATSRGASNPRGRQQRGRKRR